MNNRSVSQEKQRLDHTFQLIGTFSGDIELQSHWAKYLCVLTSGFLESSVRHLFGGYSLKKSNPIVSNYVGHNLDSFQNPKAEKILELTRFFNPEWEDQLRRHMEGERKDAINSIVITRHQIAHGRFVGITYARISAYYKNAVEVIEFLDNLLS